MARNDAPMDRGRGAGLEALALRAIAGDEQALFHALARRSRLPGPRADLAFAASFARECAALGPAVDALAARMATLDPDRYPGGTELEFLPICGVLAVGARAAAGSGERARLLAVLHDAAEDLRWRVRDAVPEALAAVGARSGDALVGEVAPWMRGFFHAAAVLRALARREWLSALIDASGPLARLDEALALAEEADRSSPRYPGYKALVDTVREVPPALALRFGGEVLARVARHTSAREPTLRAALASVAEHTALKRRFPTEMAVLVAALKASEKPRRDPRTDVGPTRRRGKR